nr:MATE family efflux transporter [Treponema sp.]
MNKSENKHTTDMTRGSPLRLILTFALPLLLGDCFQLVYSTVDTMVAGHFLGEGAIAAIGSTGVVFSLLMNFTWGLNSGYCISLSRAFGSGDRTQFRRSVAVMVLLNALIAVLFTSLALTAIAPVMRLLKTPDTIFADARRYIAIIIGGMTATVAYNMATGFMNAVGNSRVPLYFLIFSSVVNVALDLLFVALFGWGIAGCAAATVIAQSLSAVLCFAYILRTYADLLPRRSDMSRAALVPLVREMLSAGLSMALMQSVVGLGTVVLQRAINLLGTDYIAAHAASRKLFDLLMVPMSTLAIANATFTSQNYGAKRLDRIREANRTLIFWELLWSLFSVAVAWLGGRSLAVWLTGTANEVIVSNAALYLRFSTLFFFPLGVLFVLRYSMQALGHKIVPVLSSGIELTFKILFALAIVPALGYWGVILTEPITWVLCAATLAVVYVTRGRQKESKSAEHITTGENYDRTRKTQSRS